MQKGHLALLLGHLGDCDIGRRASVWPGKEAREVFLVPGCSQERKEDGVRKSRTQHLAEAQRSRGAMVGPCYQVPVNH